VEGHLICNGIVAAPVAPAGAGLWDHPPGAPAAAATAVMANDAAVFQAAQDSLSGTTAAVGLLL